MIYEGYKSVTGEKFPIDVDEYWFKELTELDRKEHNSNRRYLRHNLSLNQLAGAGIFSPLMVWDKNLIALLEMSEEEILYEAVSMLDEREKDLITAVYFRDMKGYKYAKSVGVSTSTVSRIRKRALIKLKKNYEDINS